VEGERQLELIFRDLEGALLIRSIPILERAGLDVNGNSPIRPAH
jgi:hypothetical protein